MPSPCQSVRPASGVETPGGARGLALYMQAVIQGAFVLAKAHDDPQVAAGCLDHLHDHLVGLFDGGK